MSDEVDFGTVGPYAIGALSASHWVCVKWHGGEVDSSWWHRAPVSIGVHKRGRAAMVGETMLAGRLMERVLRHRRRCRAGGERP
jgi:hypothetical protein